MIKKQLGTLAGSIMMAATSSAAITLDGNTLVVFNTEGNGSYYQLVAGSTGDTLEVGTGALIDVSAAAAALGGTIDSFALLALNSAECGSVGCYNYNEFLYVSGGGGLVFAGNSPVSTTNNAALNEVNSIQSFLSNANLGYNSEGSLGDFNHLEFFVPGLLNSNGSNLIFNQQTTGLSGTNAQQLPGYASLNGSTFTISATQPVELNSNTLVVFNTAGAGSYYQLVAGSTGDTLGSGAAFSINVSAAAAALGGTIDSFALLALNSAECTGVGCYNYSEFLYVSGGGGLVFAGNSPVSTTNNAALNEVNSIQSFLSNANLGYNSEGSPGDFDLLEIDVPGLLNYASTTNLIFNQQLAGSQPATNAQLLYGNLELNGSTLTYSGAPAPTSITFPQQESIIADTAAITVLVESGSDKSYCALFINNNLIEQDFSAPYEFSSPPLDNLADGTYNLQASCLSIGGEQTSDEITFTVNARSIITGDLSADIEQAGVVSGTVIAADPDGLTDGSYFTLKTDATYG